MKRKKYEKIITILLSLLVILSLAGCGGSGGSKKPSGLYRDAEDELSSLPDNDMTWKSNVIEDGQGRVWEYQLEGDRLDLTNKEDDSCWVCKIDFVDGTNVYDIYDYDAENELFCPFWNTYYSASKGNNSSGNNNQKEDKDTNKPSGNQKANTSIYQLDASSFKYEITTIREFLDNVREGADFSNRPVYVYLGEQILSNFGISYEEYPIDYDYSMGDPNSKIDSVYNDLIEVLGSKADQECAIISGVYSDLLENDFTKAKEEYPEGCYFEFPSEIEGKSVNMIYPDVDYIYFYNYKDYSKSIPKDTIFVIPEGVLIDCFSAPATGLKVLPSTTVFSVASGRSFADISKATNLQFFSGDPISFNSVPSNLLYGYFELLDIQTALGGESSLFNNLIEYGNTYSGNGQLNVSAKTKYFGFYDANMCNLNNVFIDSKIAKFVCNKTENRIDKLEIGSNVEVIEIDGGGLEGSKQYGCKVKDIIINDFSYDFDVVDQYRNFANRYALIDISNSMTLKGSFYCDPYIFNGDITAPISLTGSSFTIHNLTGQSIDWPTVIQGISKSDSCTFETGRIDMGKYPIDVVNN